MSASFEEKSVWIQFVSLMAILGSYFAIAAVMLANGTTAIAPYVLLFILAIVLIAVVNAAGHIIAVIVRRPEPRDERDRLIAWRAESNSGWVLAVGVCVAIGCLVISVGSVWIAHTLLLSLFVSQVVKYAFQLVYYRRGV